MRRVACFAAVLTALVGAGSALAILGGSADNGAHPYVGAARGGGMLCSGALVSPTVFVTAAHCFADGSTVRITFDENAYAGATYVNGTAHNDPAWCFGCANGLPGTDTADRAVIVLSAPVTLARYARLAGPGVAATVATVDTVGYGVQAFDKKTPTVFGTRQVVTTDVKSAGTLGDTFLKLPANPGACLGDSGGPVLAHGSDVIVAITSFGHTNCNGISYSELLDTAAALGFVRAFL